jgi:hypothetical protein
MHLLKLNLQTYSIHIIENKEYFHEIDIKLDNLTSILKQCKKNNNNRNLYMSNTYSNNIIPKDLLSEILLDKPENIDYQHLCNFISLHYDLAILFISNEIENTLNYCFEFGFTFHRHYITNGNPNSSKMKFVHELILNPTRYEQYIHSEKIKTIIYSVNKGEYYFIDSLNYIINNSSYFPNSLVNISKITLQNYKLKFNLEKITNLFEYKIFLNNLPSTFSVTNITKSLTFFDLKNNYIDGLAQTKIFIICAFIEKYGISKLYSKKTFIKIIRNIFLSFSENRVAIKAYQEINTFDKKNHSFILLNNLTKDILIDSSFIVKDQQLSPTFKADLREILKIISYKN